MISRLKAGAPVESCAHNARLLEVNRNGATEERLMVDNICRYVREIRHRSTA